MSQADLQTLLAKMVSENQKARERFARTASRTVSAIMQGDRDELSNIVRDAESELHEPSEESSSEQVEAGNTDGAAGVQGVEPSPV